MCGLDYNNFFVLGVLFISFILPCSPSLSLSHTHTPLSDVDWATGVPRRCVMFVVEFTFLCESPSGGRRRQPGPLTQQQCVFERVPRDTATGPGTSLRIHKSRLAAPLITSLFVSSGFP